jgi:hypothetical protein
MTMMMMMVERMKKVDVFLCYKEVRSFAFSFSSF